MLQYLMPVLIGIVFGLVYSNITPDITGIQNYAGSFFALQVFWCLISLTALELWNTDHVCVSREIDSKMYTALPYYLSYATNDLIILRVLPPIFFAVPFALLSRIGANDFQLLSEFCLVLVLTSCAFASICNFLGTLFRSFRVSNAVGVLTMMFSLIFGGLLVNHASALTEQKWYQPFFFATPLFYAYEALMILVLQGVNIDFNPRGFDISQKTDGGVWLANFGMHTENKYRDIVALAAFSAVFYCLAGISFTMSHFLRSCSVTSKQIGERLLESNNEGDRNYFGRDGNPEEEEEIKVAVENPLNDSVLTNESKTENELETDGKNMKHHTLAFHNVSIKIGNRQILKAVSSKASTSDNGVYAIIGPSGAGKTSLLDVIAGRKNVGIFSGVFLSTAFRFHQQARDKRSLVMLCRKKP